MVSGVNRAYEVEVAGETIDTTMDEDAATQNDTRQASSRPRNGVPKAQLPKRANKPKAENLLASAVRQWLMDVLPALVGQQTASQAMEQLASQAPKRWVIYEPMVLLPTGSFGFTCVPGGPAPASAPAPAHASARLSWQAVLSSTSDAQRDVLWQGILAALSPRPRQQLTHLAVNEGIPLHVAGSTDGAGSTAGEEAGEHMAGSRENCLRSPTGLRPLYGDFGPATTVSGREDDPCDDDLEAAFWVGTKQNGLYQTWAPRWSMFSRGNVKEKARLLAWPGHDARSSPHSPPQATAVDLYAGIGYFVFSYAQRGLRVLGWELNPWSTEALRRGAVRNGWSVRIVRGADLATPTRDVVYGDGSGSGPPSIVIFVEDNQKAARRLAELRASRPMPGPGPCPYPYPLRVTHVNGGLLPTSRLVWRTAWDAVVDSGRDARSAGTDAGTDAGADAGANTSTAADENRTRDAPVGWLHLHENVGVDEVDSRRAQIQALVDAWGAAAGDGAGQTIVSAVEHVELVKTFAPGVWHCVFDVRVEV